MRAPREKAVDGWHHLFCTECRERLAKGHALGGGRYMAISLEGGYALNKQDNIWRRHRWETPWGRGRDYRKHLAGVQPRLARSSAKAKVLASLTTHRGAPLRRPHPGYGPQAVECRCGQQFQIFVV